MEPASPTQENGLSVLSRLVVRPGVSGCLGPGDPGEKELGVGCPITSLDWEDTDTALEAYMMEVICKAVLPMVAGEGLVPIGGCEAGLLILDCDHRIKMVDIADALLRRVGKVAEEHYKKLPKHRRNERLSGGRGEQWRVVRESMARISLIQALNQLLYQTERSVALFGSNGQKRWYPCKRSKDFPPLTSSKVFDHDQLQLNLLSLPSLLRQKENVSCVVILGINMFYHQTRLNSPVSHRAHVAKLLASAEVTVS